MLKHQTTRRKEHRNGNERETHDLRKSVTVAGHGNMNAFIYYIGTGIVARCGERETTLARVTDVQVEVGKKPTINKVAAVPAASES